jgi:hypothetical protein
VSDLYCAECDRELALLQDDICGFCAKKLEARIAELEATLDKAAHQLYDYSGSCPSDLYDWEHPNTCIRECDRYDNPDEAWKCWRLWLLEKPRDEQ